MDFGLWTKVNAPGVNVDKVEPTPPTEREKAEADIDDITTVKTAEIEEFLGMSLDDDKDKKDDDEEMPDYGADDAEVEVIDDDEEEEKPSAGEKRKPEGLPESSSVGAAPKVATKKMPKPLEREQRRKVQKIVKYDDTHEKDVPLQLQPGLQSYIGPEHMLKVCVRPMDDRLTEISHSLSNHLRGVQEQRRKPTTAFNDDGSKDWKGLMRHHKVRLTYRIYMFGYVRLYV